MIAVTAIVGSWSDTVVIGGSPKVAVWAVVFILLKDFIKVGSKIRGI